VAPRDPPSREALRRGHAEAGAEAGTPPVDALGDQGEAVYLYCVARRHNASRQTGVSQPDLDGGEAWLLDGEPPLTLIPFKDVVAIVSAVNVDDFCGVAAEARMKDLAWVAPRACRHETVVETVMRGSPVVPARFGTLFSSRERLVAWLTAHHVAIAQALDRFADHEEWAVKGRVNTRAAEAALVAARLARHPAPASPGARYLEERRIRAGVSQDLTAWLQTLCEQSVRHLRAHAAAFRERAVGSGASEGGWTPVLNWAFLVPCGRLDDFRVCVQQITAMHAEHGFALDCSGPWPPYSFGPALGPEGAA